MITIYGWESFEAWRDAGYPGSVKAPKQERLPDERRGLCEWQGQFVCKRVAHGFRMMHGLHLCEKHGTIQEHIDWANAQALREKVSA